MKKTNIKKLTVSAIMIALSTLLSMIVIFKLPLEGTITFFSMLPICLVSITYGLRWGLGAAFVYSLGQLVQSIGAVAGWGLTKEAFIGTILLDYILPFTLLGLAGLFRKHGKIGAILGIVTVMIIRFTCHFISGTIIFDIWSPWDNAIWYSFCYNGIYMLPETIMTGIGAYFLLSSKAITNLINAE